MIYAVFYPDGTMLKWSEVSDLGVAQQVAREQRRKLGIKFYAGLLSVDSAAYWRSKNA